ncbi:VPS8 [Mytilus edulis]|uniref:VPS8 n=1 Tax=Mytilus edulis TaxID=6550 RepID=A0A8S3V5L2_MYTED|nr:VPS8 [Mytilus edulis]
MADHGDDVVQSTDKHRNYPSQNRHTKLQTKSKTEGLYTPQTIRTEEENLLQAAYTVLFTVPRALEHFIDKNYTGGFLQSIRDHKDCLKTKIRTEERDLMSKIIVHHRLYHFYDQIIQDTILDHEVLDLLISKCVLRKEDRAEIEHHPRQSDRNKCILDLLIQRPQDSYSALLDVLKESSTCSKDFLECLEGQRFSHPQVGSESKVKSCITGFHSVRIQKNYHNLTQNLSNTECIIDSLISKEVLDPDDRAEIISSGVQSKINRKLIHKIRSEKDYRFFLKALKEDPMNAKLVSDLESTDVKPDELKLLQTGYILPSLTNTLGCTTLVILVSMVKSVHLINKKPESNDTSLPADLYRLQSWYKRSLK